MSSITDLNGLKDGAIIRIKGAFGVSHISYSQYNLIIEVLIMPKSPIISTCTSPAPSSTS